MIAAWIYFDCWTSKTDKLFCFSEFIFLRHHRRARRYTQSWLRLEIVVQMLRTMEEIMLCRHDHFMWHVHLNGVGLWIRIYSLLPHMVCNTLYEGFGNKLWSVSEDICYHNKLLPGTLLWSMRHAFSCF
jgi:hypothetical protein